MLLFFSCVSSCLFAIRCAHTLDGCIAVRRECSRYCMPHMQLAATAHTTIDVPHNLIYNIVCCCLHWILICILLCVVQSAPSIPIFCLCFAKTFTFRMCSRTLLPSTLNGPNVNSMQKKVRMHQPPKKECKRALLRISITIQFAWFILQ